MSANFPKPKDYPALLIDQKKLIIGLILYKSGVLTLLTLFLLLFGEIDEDMFNRGLQRWPRDGGPIFLSHFATWDTPHYLFLSEVGYQKDSPSCAFYPLWPHLVKWCSVVFGNSHLLSGIVLSNGFSTLGIVMFHQMIKEKIDRHTAFWATVVLLSYPGSLFFFFHYTESLFFCLLMIFCWGWHRQKMYLVALAGLLLPMTRAVGVFCVVPLAWGIWNRSRSISWILMLELPILGWGAYFLWMQILTGNPWEGFDAQKHWPVNSIGNLFDPVRFIEVLFSPSLIHGYYGSLIDRIWFVFLLSMLPLVWLRDREWFWWVIMLGVIPAVLSHFVSFTRYMTMAFPLYTVVGWYLAKHVPLSFRWVFAGGLILMQAWLLWRHMNFDWAG